MANLNISNNSNPDPRYQPANVVPKHALTHASGGADDLYSFGGHMNVARIESIPRWISNTGFNLQNGFLLLTYFTPDHFLRVSNFLSASRSTAAAGATLARLGLYTVDGTGTNHTLVAASASNTSLWSTTNTIFTQAFAAANGLPATIDMVPSQRYAIGHLIVGATTLPQICGIITSAPLIGNLNPVMQRSLGGYADLPTTVTSSANGQTTAAWCALT